MGLHKHPIAREDVVIVGEWNTVESHFTAGWPLKTLRIGHRTNDGAGLRKYDQALQVRSHHAFAYNGIDLLLAGVHSEDKNLIPIAGEHLCEREDARLSSLANAVASPMNSEAEAVIKPPVKDAANSAHNGYERQEQGN